MPSIPLPPQVPIERAGWNTDFSGNVQLPNNERTPVNPIMSGLSQASQEAQTALQSGQAANAVQDVQMKQRGMQSSMLGALASLPPDQFEANKATTIATINKLNPSMQYSPDIDQKTAQMAAMYGVPVEQQPTYGLNQSNAAINMALLKALGGPSAASGGATLGNPGQIPENGNPSSAITPAASEGAMTPQAQALLALARPESSKALQGTPLYKEQASQAETLGKNAAEAQKNALESNESYQVVQQNLDGLKKLIGTTNEKGELIPNPDLPQSEYGFPAKNQAWASQNFGDQKKADAYNTFQTLNESQTIGAIRQLADTGQIKMTRTLENIINRGYLIDPDVSPKAKLQQAYTIETELKNSAAAAQNVATKMGGGRQTQTYQSPLASSAVTQAQEKLQPKQEKQQSTPIVNTQSAFDALPSGTIYAEPDGKKYRKP